MEEYTQCQQEDELSKSMKIIREISEQNQKSSHFKASLKENRKVTWSQRLHRRSSESSKKSFSEMTLKLNSKQGSIHDKQNENENNVKKKTLSDFILEQESVSVLNPPLERRQDSASKLRKQIQFNDDRQENILLHKQKSNIVYMMAQTKQLIDLTKSLLLKQQCKQLRTQIMELELKVRRLRISSRKKNTELKQRQQKVREQYYDENRKLSNLGGFNNTKSIRSIPKYELSQYYDTNNLNQLRRQRSQLLQLRISNLKQQIQREKQLAEQRQSYMKQEISLLRKESQSYQKTNKQLSNCALGLESRVSALSINNQSQNYRILSSDKNRKIYSPRFGLKNSKIRSKLKATDQKQNKKKINSPQHQIR